MFRLNIAWQGFLLYWQKLLVLVLAALWLTALAAVPLGVGLALLPPLTDLLRRSAEHHRELAGRATGTPVASPYRPAPPGDGTLQRARWILTDPATWRDLIWWFADPVVGGLLVLLPAALLLEGVWGLLLPFFWDRLLQQGYDDWYLFLHVQGSRSLLTIPLGLLLIAAGYLAAPSLWTAHARWTRALLAPDPNQRIRHLEHSRGEVIDAQAAELRRIERDLHDGAQARLVAMGMHLGAAERLLESDPDAARKILADLRQSSSQALAELRDLVRGIHPPVLSDRGLVDAVRALALDSGLPVEVITDLDGRPSPPIESAVYFTVTELLANAAKHSSATEVLIGFEHDDDLLRVIVRDDGRGGARFGTGLLGVQKRLAAFDGSLTLSSPIGGPTAVTMEIPCALSSQKTSSS
ncbi:sensor histidine kinase [Actinocorallia longicatena]|uniref:histidine kinase n=1 Tax=Actinocorallia longicatena TaxID=111803 RepID=A0ABP6QA20_9ACTN